MAGMFDRLQSEVNSREQQKGLSPIDLLDLPDSLATVIKSIVRKNGMSLPEIAEMLEQPPSEIQKTLDELVEKGYIRRYEVGQEIWYKAHFGRKADKPLSHSVWSVLDDLTEPE